MFDTARPEIEAPERPAGMLRAGESIAILPLPDPEDEDEERYTDCVVESLQENYPEIPVVSEETFWKNMGPALDPEAIPPEPSVWQDSFKNPEIRQQVAAWNLRYLVLVGGKAARSLDKSSWLFLLLMGLGVIIEEKIQLQALILDVHHPEDYQTVETRAEGQDSFGTLFIFYPAILSTAVRDPACQALGEQVARVLTGTPFQQPAKSNLF